MLRRARAGVALGAVSLVASARGEAAMLARGALGAGRLLLRVRGGAVGEGQRGWWGWGWGSWRRSYPA